VLTIDQPQFMTEIKILPVKSTPCGDLRVHPGVPLAALHQHPCIRDQRVAADVVEMKMRVDDEVDLARISIDRFEPSSHLFARLKANTKKSGKPLTEPSSGVVLTIGMQPGVE